MGSQLNRVTTTVPMLPPRIVIHSEGGAGKTTLGADVPGAIFLPVEDGLGTLSVPHFTTPESFAEVEQALGELLTEKHDYKALVVDTIDHVEPLVWQAVCDEHKKGSIEDFGYGKGYTYTDPLWDRLLKACSALREKRKMTVVILAHSARVTVDDPLIGPHDRIGIKLHKRASALLYEWADIVGFLAVDKLATDKEGAKGRSMRTGITTGQRVLYLEDTGSFVAKNRYSLPPEIEIPKASPYGPLRAELLKAMGINETKPKQTKEAA